MKEIIELFSDFMSEFDRANVGDVIIMRNIYLFLECYVFVIQEDSITYKLGYVKNKMVKIYKILETSYLEFEEKEIFPYKSTILNNQINKFRYKKTASFFYDFNHDGNDEIINFFPAGRALIYTIKAYDFLKNKIILLLNVELPLPLDIPGFEFILYRGIRGIKIYEFNYRIEEDLWVFYYYDRIRQEYVMDETASSEELAQIHGSPDFFAEAGIDYTKLERPLVAADLEGFSKAALRIWRNAVYAKHGRTFKSEDLQALFNEYVWYKADENYTDEKLSDIDKANIRLIQRAEAKLEH